MKIVIVGATGNLGSHAVNEALEAGHEVVAYVRRPELIRAEPSLTVIQGDAADSAAFAAAVSGADVVIVSITGSMRDATFMQRTLPEMISPLKQEKVERLVLVSAFGAGDTAEKASWFARLVYRTALGKFLADKAAGDRQLIDSGIGYTLVYPVNLKDAPALPSTGVRLLSEVSRVPGLPTLPYANAAQALVQVATDPTYLGQRVLVTTPTGWIVN